MCYDVISCPDCGEWLDEFSASIHQCTSLLVEEVEEAMKKQIEEKKTQRKEPILVSIPSKRKNPRAATNN